MGEEKYTECMWGIFQWFADKSGTDVYYVNFIILMFFTLFEVAAVFFDYIPGTDIESKELLFGGSNRGWDNQRIRDSHFLHALEG